MVTENQQPPAAASRDDRKLRIIAGASSIGCYMLSRESRKRLPLSAPFNGNFGKGFDHVEDIGFALFVGEGCYHGLKYLTEKSHAATRSEQIGAEKMTPPVITR